jgi:hypothetical protein
MNAAAKLTSFAAVVAAVFGGALSVGAAVGPIDVGDDSAHETLSTVVEQPGGLAVAAAGYRFEVEQTTLETGADQSLAFRILDDTGAPTTRFDELHERKLHSTFTLLIARPAERGSDAMSLTLTGPALVTVAPSNP